jgi:ADP-heptose:LPS heptosyltransferase
MQGLLRTGIMNLFARAPLKLCRRDQREGAQMFANKIVDFPTNGSRHAVDLLMEFLPPLGLKKEYSPLKLKPEAISSAPKLPDGTILIFPSSRGKWAQKEWPFMRELTAEILNEQKYSPTVCIGPASFGPIAWCSDEKLDVPTGALDFCQKVTLGQLLPFISQAALVIGNDAGPTHMAAALGVPTLGLYGPTKPQLAGPYPLTSSRNINLRASSKKMEDISVEEVFGSVKKLLL